MSLEILAWASLLLAQIPAVMLLVNLPLLRRPRLPERELPPVSVLVPARDEESSIAACIESVLALSLIHI